MTIRQLISNYAANSTIMFQCDAFMQKSYFVDGELFNRKLYESVNKTIKLHIR